MFDSEALSKAVQGDREMAALIKTAPRLGIPIVTSALTTLRTWDPCEASKQALWNWSVFTEPGDPGLGRSCGGFTTKLHLAVESRGRSPCRS
ncbi:hypothetical protein L1856_22055 [Streptomyces sp. Tue 6430]|nr:hypothetical protein [Streptomyces sp. Tue 6430]